MVSLTLALNFLRLFRGGNVAASFGLDPDGQTAAVLKVFAYSPRLLIVEVMNLLEGDIPDDRSKYQSLHRRYKYHLDKLVEDDFLARMGKRYVLTKKGRDFLVACGVAVPELWSNPVIVPVVLIILSAPFLFIGVLDWKIVWYSMSSGVPSFVRHSFDVSKVFLPVGSGLFCLGLGVLLGRGYARR